MQRLRPSAYNWQTLVLSGLYALSIVALWLPWFTLRPRFDTHFTLPALSGETWLMALCILVLCVLSLGILLTPLWQHLRGYGRKATLLRYASVIILCLTVLAWSVLASLTTAQEGSTIRYGLWLLLLTQAAILLLLWAFSPVTPPPHDHQ